MPARFLLFALLLTPAISHAYVGPGIGFGVIATLMAMGSAFFVMLFHFVVAPLRKLLGKDKHDTDDTEPQETEPQEGTEEKNSKDGNKEN